MIFKFHLSPHWQSPPPTSTSIAAAHCALHVRVGATNGGCLGQCHLRCAPATLTDISPKYPMIMAAKDYHCHRQCESHYSQTQKR